jgi:peptidyl-prolyl cis-trans isomerase D
MYKQLFILFQTIIIQESVMLENIRQVAHNKIFKIFLLLIAITFAISLGDLGNTKNNHVIATVGKEKITIDDFSKAKHNELTQLNQQQHLSPEQLEQQQKNINQIVLNKLISQSLLNQEIKNLGIKAPAEILAEYIHKDPSFHKNGAFDLDTYKKILEANNITEKTLLDNLSTSVSSKFLLNSLLINNPLKNKLSDYLYNYLAEKRSISLVSVDTSNLILNNFNDSDLENYYKKHPEFFQSQETRDFSYLLINESNIKNNLTITEADLELEYNKNIEEYSIPETRDLHHFLTPDQDTANQIYESLKQNSDHITVANNFIDKKVINEKFNNQPQQSFLTNLSPDIFEIKESDITNIVKSELGWHIFKVTKIHPKKYKSLAEVKDIVKKTLTRKVMEVQLYELSKQIEDELASGAEFKDIATRYGLSSFEANKVNANTPNNNIDKRIIETAFKIGLNEDSSVKMLDDTLHLFVVKVNKIDSPKLEEFSQVKKQVKQQLDSEYKTNIALEVAKILQTEASKKDQNLITNDRNHNKVIADQLLTNTYNKYKLLASNKPIISLSNQSVVREMFGENKDLPEIFINNIFNQDVKRATAPFKANANKYIFALVQKIELDKDRNPEIYSQIDYMSESNYKNEIYEQYLDYLRKKYPVTINLSLINNKN